MACNKNRYTPVFKQTKTIVPLSFKKYDNNGEFSKIIK